MQLKEFIQKYSGKETGSLKEGDLVIGQVPVNPGIPDKKLKAAWSVVNGKRLKATPPLEGLSFFGLNECMYLGHVVNLDANSREVIIQPINLPDKFISLRNLDGNFGADYNKGQLYKLDKGLNYALVIEDFYSVLEN